MMSGWFLFSLAIFLLPSLSLHRTFPIEVAEKKAVQL